MMPKIFYFIFISLFIIYLGYPVNCVKYSQDEISSFFSQQQPKQKYPISTNENYEIPYKPYSSYILDQRYQYHPHGIKRVSEHDINTLLRNTWIG
ncbi:Hypothetical protein SRAE_X000024100 [Strongyloides ratti]|uniref:Uncharacterized protein n=1 Tax=Strongyloides ratti TaxID=34506 RepID=A0A090LME0_STRRB|nr:Hypothetical protein SRAE_X000024100 [Strongyloides ratti]CEF70911.1 Hypothetical protein SRAE_X000024100 [Strongyloides ratti]